MVTQYTTPVTAAEFTDLIDGIEWAQNPNQGAAIQDILSRLTAIQAGWELAQSKLIQVNPTTPPVFSDFAGQWENAGEVLPITAESFANWYRLKGSPADYGGQFMYLNGDEQRLEHRAWHGKSELFEVPLNTFGGTGGAGTTFSSVGTLTITLKSPAWLIFRHTGWLLNNATGADSHMRWNYQLVSGTGNYSETVLGTWFVKNNLTKRVYIRIAHPVIVPAGTVQIQLRCNRPNSDSLLLFDENVQGFNKSGTTSRVEAFYI